MKSYIKYYAITYYVVYGITLYLKATHVIRGFGSSLPLFFCWFLFMFVNFFELYRFINYIQDKHPKLMDDLCFFPSLGVLGVNSIKVLAFVFTADELNDDNLRFLKTNYMKLMALVVSIFISIIIFVTIS